MARIFKDFENINMNDFVPFDKGYHVLTITSHKEDTMTNRNGEVKDIDVFEVTSDTGATMRFNLYYGEKTLWTYKKLLHSCGAKTDEMKGNQNIDLDKLVGKRFGAFVDIEEQDKWDETKGQTVTKKYPRVNANKFYTESKCIELMEKSANDVIDKANKDLNNWNNNDMTPIDDGDVPF